MLMIWQIFASCLNTPRLSGLSHFFYFIHVYIVIELQVETIYIKWQFAVVNASKENEVEKRTKARMDLDL